MCIFSSILKIEKNSKMRGSKRLLKAIFFVCRARGAYIPYFKISPTIFSCPLFSENYLNLQVRINKMVNKYTVNYHPSPLQLISRIHSFIFLISPMLIVLRLLTNTFASQKLESVHFYLWPQEKPSRKFLSLPPQAEGNYPFLPNRVF